MGTLLNGFSKILKGKFKLRLDNLTIRIIQIKVLLKEPCTVGQSQSTNLEDKLQNREFCRRTEKPEEQGTKILWNVIKFISVTKSIRWWDPCTQHGQERGGAGSHCSEGAGVVYSGEKKAQEHLSLSTTS